MASPSAAAHAPSSYSSLGCKYSLFLSPVFTSRRVVALTGRIRPQKQLVVRMSQSHRLNITSYFEFVGEWEVPRRPHKADIFPLFPQSSPMRAPLLVPIPVTYDPPPEEEEFDEGMEEDVDYPEEEDDDAY